MSDYDVVGGYQDIEDTLLQSMRDNMRRHIGEENAEGLDWSQWQAEMLRGLQQYRTDNAEMLQGAFTDINDKIDAALRQAYSTGASEQEIEILNQIKHGFKPDKTGIGTAAMQGAFFKVNDAKLNALINSVQSDFNRANMAILRRTEDAYRKTIFNAQMYYNSGAGSLWQAVDKASHDFLAQGINCVRYANGANVNIVSYSEMALRTGSKRANLMGAAEKRQEYGISTVKVTSRLTACPMCLQYLGQVYIDDVYATPPTGPQKYPLLSTAVNGGLFHPNCKDGLSTYYEGVSQPPKPPTAAQKEEAVRRYALEQRQRQCERNIRSYKRLANGAIDNENAARYNAKLQQWRAAYTQLVKANGDVLRVDTARLRLYGLDRINNSTINAPISKYKGAEKVAQEQAKRYTYVKANSISEAEGYLRNTLGIETSYKGIDLRVANGMNEAFTDAINYCPDIKQRMQFCGSAQERNRIFKQELEVEIKQIYREIYGNKFQESEILKAAKREANRVVGRRVDSHTLAFASSGRVQTPYKSIEDICHKYAGINVNNIYGADADAFTRALKQNVVSKFHPIGCDTVRSVFDHEVAHQLDYALDVSKDAETIKLWGEFKALSLTDRDAALSRYAYKEDDIMEFVAEGYAEYCNNPQPRKYAAAIGKIIERLATK